MCRKDGRWVTGRCVLITGPGGTLGDGFRRALYTQYDIAAVHCNRPPGVPSQIELFVNPQAELPESNSRVP